MLNTALLILAAFIAGKGLLMLTRLKECPLSDRTLYLILAGVTILPRLFLILTVKVNPRSDYELYYQSAAALAATGTFPVTDYTIAVAPYILSFIGVLGGVMKVFGTSLFTAQLFNLALLAGCVVFVFALARQLVSKNAAILAALLYALSPNSMLFSLCVASEPLALLLLLAGLYAALAAFRSGTYRAGLLWGFLAGILLGFSSSMRMSTLAVLVSVFLYGLLYLLLKGKWRKPLAALLSIAAGFALINALMNQLAWSVYQVKPGMSFGWALYEGLDSAGNGMWTQENHDVLMAVLKQFPPSMVQEEMLRLALERIKGYDFLTWVRLIANKGLNIWVYSDYAYGEVLAAQDVAHSLIQLSTWSGLLKGWINIVHQGLLAFFAVQGIICTLKGRTRGDLVPVWLPILGFVIAHSLVTSIPRYQYMAIPLFLLSAIYFIERGQGKFPQGIAS